MKKRLLVSNHGEESHHNESGDEEEVPDVEQVVVTRHPKMRMRMVRLLFYSQLTISLMALVFCGAMLAIQEHSCETQAYLALMSGIVAYWLPQPRTS